MKTKEVEELKQAGNLETQRLCQEYGYPDKVLKNKKVLNISIIKTPTLIANRYYFSL